MSQAHGQSLWTEPAQSGAVPFVVLLSLTTASPEGHTFAAGASVGSLVANGTEGFDATLADFSANAGVVFMRGDSTGY